MSRYATNYVIDENGNTKLIKHLNKMRIDRSTLREPSGKWGKTGAKARNSKPWNKRKKESRRQNKVKV